MSRKLAIVFGAIVAVITLVLGFPILIVIFIVGLLSGDDGDVCTPTDVIVTASNTGATGLNTQGPHATEFFNQFAKGTQKEQRENAQTIYEVGVARSPDGVTQLDIAIALATSIQESNLTNIYGGDRDSLGLFQQRPSQGWGTPAEIMDPVYAANKFYDALITVGSRDSRPIIKVAMDVQRPNEAAYYARWKWDNIALEMVGSADIGIPTEVVQQVSEFESICDNIPPTDVYLVVQTVIDQVGKPYTWADGDANGFDGSGLYHWAYGEHDISIPRTSYEQYVDGEKIARDDLRPGDLVFWGSNPEDASTITSVSMYIGNDQIVEAPGANANILVVNMRNESFVGAIRPVSTPEIVLAANGSVAGWQLPLDPGTYRVTSGWGESRGSAGHNGIDLAAPAGTPIHAIADGVITIRQYGMRGKDTHWNSGNVIYIRHADGSGSGYAHMSRFADNIAVGTQVKMGDVIGYVGDTGLSAGNHLHLTVETDHDNIVQVDPEPFFAAKGLRF